MLIIGLTGSIGMGKSETAKMFAKLGVPVFDADKIVHRFYQKGGKAVDPIAEVFPRALKSGAIDRGALSLEVLDNAAALKKLEAIVHPLVRDQEASFLREAERSGAKTVLLDIPLLFETRDLSQFDKIIVVSAPLDVQYTRVMAREGMTEKKFKSINDKQMPDHEKRAKADFVIETDKRLDDAFEQVAKIIQALETMP